MREQSRLCVENSEKDEECCTSSKLSSAEVIVCRAAIPTAFHVMELFCLVSLLQFAGMILTGANPSHK